MNTQKPLAVIGTNSWGSKIYGKLLRGSSVDEVTIKESVKVAREKKLLFFDLARDYGFGKAQKMMGEFGTQDIVISSKFTPFKKYHSGQVRKSLERDLVDFKRTCVDIYWLHLPKDIEENLMEMIQLYREGKIHNIGISNFSLEECKRAKEILENENIPLYGVQNHYSLLNRDWEERGVVSWCKENGLSFWAWAVLEEGMLADPRVKTPKSIMKLLFQNKKRKLHSLYILMNRIGKRHAITIPQVAIAYCSNKGIVPVCGCRTPYQVEQLFEAVNVKLPEKEIHMLEQAADASNVRIIDADNF
ncbi:MAG: aldo/keto reductase [Lachnospiraceae bacterium]|nr:aldo/keto reductase [Lachnospiraceae bacterium]